MMKNLKKKTVTALSKIAKALAIANVNATCTGIIHQPKMPKELLKYKK